LYFNTTCLTPPHLCACLKPGPGFPMPYVVVLFLCSVSSVEKKRGDIGRIVDHQCLNFL
jgi:hypothetical protein